MFHTFLISLTLMTQVQGSTWHTNMEEARILAKKEHRYILLNFSGSDWCEPCIFVVAGAVCLLVALITVSFQAVRAATASPVKSLQAE